MNKFQKVINQITKDTLTTYKIGIWNTIQY